ncbi:MAG: hypothetical protein WBP42_10265 [Candidatus Zixiibacteriota bacterium]
MRKLMLLVVSLAFLALFSSTAFAFHDGGVAYCGGCHTMHNSVDGALVDAAHPNGNAYLLKYASASDLCLSCHATSRGAVWGADPLNPPAEKGAGNFVFLTEDNLNDGHNGHLSPIPGRAAGHNVNAPSQGAGPDGTLLTAPGGTFPSNRLECSSCHDPHGNQNFRLLYGVGPVQVNLTNFVNPAPDAEGNSYNTAETNAIHTAYKGGMGAWCGNCHGDFHANNTKLIHPSGRTLGGSIANAYNSYNGTDDITGGSQATAYISAVPFEDPSNTTTSTAGPSATSQVSCITCHRAHATSAQNAGRWDFGVTFLHEDGVESGSYAIPNPYNSLNQRSLCNKCHVKDAGDAPFEP